MTEIILVRHGKTLENEQGICQGQTEGTLSETGVKQNKYLATLLKKETIDVFYSSPLRRAILTLKAIIKEHPDQAFFEDIQLAEWGLGNLEGKPFPPNFDILTTEPTMESVVNVKNRCLSFLNHLKANHQNQTVLVVSHGLIIRMFESLLLRVDFSETRVMENSTYKIFHL